MRVFIPLTILVLFLILIIVGCMYGYKYFKHKKNWENYR